MPNPEFALQNSLTQVRTAMTGLNGMNVAAPVRQPPIAPGELDRPINFVWSGLLDQGVQRLAGTVGYQVNVTAPQNSKPLEVSVNMSNVTALDVFRALGTAAGTAATVIVDPQHHTVTVEHHV
jgi:defect-in-organelle-trafficking protein DotD